MATTTELQAQLLSQASSVIDAVSKAASAAAAELPEIATQYITYGQFMNTAIVLLGIVIFCIGAYVSVAYGFLNRRKFVEKNYGGWADERFTCAFLGGIAAVVGFGITTVNFANFALVWFAPKVWLIKEIGHLLK